MRNSDGSGYCSCYDPESGLFTLLATLSIKVTEEIETGLSQGSPYFEPGPLVDYDEMETTRSLPLEIEIEQLTELHLGLILNRKAQSNTFNHPIAQRVPITSTTVAVPGLTSDQPTLLTELLTIAPGQRQFMQVPALDGPSVSGEYSVDTDSLIFHADDVGAGKSAGLRYMTTSTKVVYGGPNAINSFNAVEIYIEQSHTKIAKRALYFPKVKINNGAQFSMQAGGDPVTITGRALIDSSKGFADYFADWRVD